MKPVPKTIFRLVFCRILHVHIDYNNRKLLMIIVDNWTVCKIYESNTGSLVLIVECAMQYSKIICMHCANLASFAISWIYAIFNIISVIVRRKFTYSWSQGKQTSTRQGSMSCLPALRHDNFSATGDRTRDARFQMPDANHSATADYLACN